MLLFHLLNRAVKRSTCFHDKGHNAKCGVSGNLYMLIYGAIEIFLSQCPNLEKVAILSVIAAVTSFAYALIALCLSTAKLSSNHEFKGSLMVAMVGNTEATSERFWQAFQALGNIALAYTYCMLLLEIQVLHFNLNLFFIYYSHFQQLPILIR